MKRSILGTYLTSILRSPDATEGISITGEADLDQAVLHKLGLNMGAAPPATAPDAGAKKLKGTTGDANDEDKTAQEKKAREDAETKAAAAEKEKQRIAERAEELGVTDAEVIAIEKAEAAEEERIEKLIEETGKTREEILAEEEAAGDGSPESAGEVPADFTEEHKEWLAKHDEEAQAQLTAKGEELEQAQARIQELETQVAAGGDQAVAIAPIEPMFLLDDPAKLQEEDGKLAQFEAYLLKHFDGIEAVEAKGDQPGRPAYTAEQVRERYAQIREIRQRIVPAAREAIEQRKKHEAAARKVYPELFDAKRPEFKVAQNILRLAPGLKAVIPNIHVVIGDAIRGERQRLAQEKARLASKNGKPAAGGGAKPKLAPKIPTRAAPAGVPQSRVPAKKKDEAGIDVQKFMESGGNRNALVAAISP